MLNRLTKLATGIVIAGSLTALVWGQAAPAWKDQGESDLGLAAGAEKDPNKQLDLIKKWEQQYPDSALKGQRTLMTATALQTIMGAAYGKPAGDPSLAPGEKAALQIIDHYKEYFDDSVKPAAATPDQWATVKKTFELQPHLVLASIYGATKDDAKAEVEYKKILQLDPTQAMTSYNWASAILRQMMASKNLARYSEALYDYARALSVTGPNALPPAGQTAVKNSLTKNYSNYHGSAQGVDDLIKLAAGAAIPPDGFHLQSIEDIEAEKEKNHAAWAAANPELAFWDDVVKAALMSQGDAAFASMKDAGFPPPQSDTYKGAAMFKGTVVSQTDKTILVNVDAVAGDATLKFDDNVTIKGTIPQGTGIQFKGVVDAYTKDPAYNLTMLIQEPKTDLVGIPDGVTFVTGTGAAKPGAKGGSGAKAAPKAGAKTAPKAATK